MSIAYINSKAHGSRLSGNYDGTVDLTYSSTYTQQWEWQWISPNKFFWKHRATGLYLRAWPDGHLDLTSNRDAWEIWTKHDHGSHILWQSCHGTFLSANPNRSVCLRGNQQGWEHWGH